LRLRELQIIKQQNVDPAVLPPLTDKASNHIAYSKLLIIYYIEILWRLGELCVDRDLNWG
jgi:hypothetical protein